MSDSKPYSIKVENLNKIFKIPHENRNRAKDYFLHPFKRTGYEQFHAVKDVSFEIPQGEFFGIIGKNGSGKSTLLKLLAGIYVPTSGNITMNGVSVPFLELGVGFNPELSARENVFLNGVILGMTKKFLESKYDEIIKFAEVENFMDAQLKTFSSGMMLRLAFSIAMQRNADIYLLDEILSVGDNDFQKKSLAKFMELKSQGKTLVLVSHALGFMKEFCTSAIYMKHGELQAQGSAEEIIDMYLENEER